MGSYRPEDITIVDMEASIEHLTRGTLRTVDLLLLVSEPYYRSLETLGRMDPLAKELGIPHVVAIANKVRTPDDEAAIREYAQRRDIDLVAVIPFDDQVTQSDNAGQSLIDAAPNSAAVTAIRQLVDTIEQRWGSVAPVK